MVFRPTLLKIDLDALASNYRTVEKLSKQTSICAVVKADAYGYGASPVAQRLEFEGCPWFAVALVEEGISLRNAGITKPILVLGAHVENATETLIEHKLIPTIFSLEQLESLNKTVKKQQLEIHLKLDTGMSRLGLRPQELPKAIKLLKKKSKLKLAGLMSHLANADLDDSKMNSSQQGLLLQAYELLKLHELPPKWLHLCNSAGVINAPKKAQNLIRPGLLLYGLNPMGPHTDIPLKPVASWHTKPLCLRNLPSNSPVSYGGHFRTGRPTTLAVLPVGYADGYKKSFEGRAEVLIRNQRAPIVGSICMDMCMADVTDIPNVCREDQVTLLGAQGRHEITAYELATWAETIPYEIMCSITERVPRHYFGQGAPLNAE